MIGFNVIVMLGRVSKDAEIKYYIGGKRTANFSIATRNGKAEAPQYINCRAIGDEVEKAMKYCKRGRLVFIRGELCVNWYKKHGDNAYNPYIAVKHIECVPSSVIVSESSNNDKFGIYEEI